MADATAARDKDHPHRREPGGILRVVPGPARQVHGGETCRLRRFADGLLEDRIRSRRLVSGERNAFDLDVFFPGDCSETFPDPRPDPFDFCALEVAQFDWKFHAPWNDVARSGFDPHITHRANLPAGLRPDFFAHCKHTARAAAASASCRRFIGVVPAWLANPVATQVHQLIPTMPCTTPMGMRVSSSTAPCSI